MIFKSTALCYFLLFSVGLFSQTGPGGIGNNTSNGLWLRADSFSTFGTVNSWLDTSGNFNNAGQVVGAKQPVSVASSNLNGMPIIRFDGNDDEMVVADADILDGTSGITFFTVLKPNNLDGSPRGVLGKRVTFSDPQNYSYSWFMHTSNFLNLDVVTNNNRFSTSPKSFSNAVNYILSFTFNGILEASQRSKIYSEMELVKTSFDASDILGNSDQPLAIGVLNENYRFKLGADYAEIIHFNYAVTEVDRIIINNYLSAKYNITLTSNNFYNEDDAISGNFDFNVAGIGQAFDDSRHTNSRGSGIITIKNPKELDRNEYLFWGENNRAATYNFSESSTGNNKYRVNTIWRVSEIGEVGTVGFSVKSTDLDFTAAPIETLQLICSSTANFNTITKKYNLSLSNGVYSAPAVAFDDTDYFTLEIVPTVDLNLIKKVNKAAVKKGEIVFFTISVTNSGNNTATGIQVKDNLPAELLYDALQSTIPPGTTYNAGSGIWDLGNVSIIKGQTRTLILAATAQTVTNTLTKNKAEIIAIDQEDIDSVPNNAN